MGLLFKDDLHDEFGRWPLGYAPYGGADFGEVLAVAKAVGDGDDAAFHDAWVAAADRLCAQAKESLAKGRTHSARALFLRAACFYAASFHPLYGAPVDPRVVAAHRKQIAAFDSALALFEPAIKPLRIPFESTTMPAYFIPAAGRAEELRPLVIFINGYDASITDLYFASAAAASARGYHSLIFDGPGQGEMLIEQHLPLRPDWENVITPVVDFAQTLPTVDRDRICLSGWSLGGYLSTRAASGEHRLAACIADPGFPGIASGFIDIAIKLGVPSEEAIKLGRMDPKHLDRMWRMVEGDRKLHWSVVQRGFWVNGASDFAGFLDKVGQFALGDRVGQIRCPTLLTYAENDHLNHHVDEVFSQLKCRKSLIRFTAEEGAGDHCELMNRSLLNQRVFDWLDAVLAQSSPASAQAA